MPLVHRRPVAPFALVAITLALLTGCTPEAAEPEESGPNPSGDATGAPAPQITDQPAGTPIDATCSDLVSADTLYLFNPNFGAIDSFTPTAGSAAASAVKYQGIACRWQNQTSGDNIDVAAAHLDDSTLTALKNSAFETSEMVPTYGDEAYFTVADNGVGTAQVFQGSYWIVVESPAFYEPGDATEIVQSVIAGLGA